MLSTALRSFHDSVFVLTIPSSEERQTGVIEQLGNEGFEFVYGLDKHNQTKEQLINDGVYDEEMARREDPKDLVMTLGHVCCAFGHRTVYQKFLETGSERALIFEDDVVDLQEPDEYIETALNNLPVDWEIIYWGWTGGRFKPVLGGIQQVIFHERHVIGLYKYNHRMIRNSYMRRYNDYFDVSSANFLLHAYLLTRSGDEKLIKWNTPIHLNSDHVPIHAILDGDFRGYVSRRQIFGQRSFNPADPIESLTQKYY